MAESKQKFEFKFKAFPPILHYSVVNLRGVPRNWEKARESMLQNPKSLVELASEVVDGQALPECMFWDTAQVLEWLENTVQLPQYKVCFSNNFVLGRQLIMLGPNHLERMNIKQFDHIKRITKAIRDLYNVPMPKFAKDLSLPLIYGTAYDWNTLYYRHVARQSPNYATPRTLYWQSLRLLHKNSLPQATCHWHTISVEREEEKVRLARYRKNKIPHYWTPMFREGNFVPTQQKLEYFFIDPFRY